MRVHYLLIICAASLAAQGFRAGTARRDVTPTEPVPMWGYADRHPELSSGVDDPLYADALVIDAGGSKLAIVGLISGARRPIRRLTGSWLGSGAKPESNMP